MSRSLLLTNVNSFQEIPGRRRQFSRGQFDILEQTFIGPTAYKDIYIPALDSQNGWYPLMNVVSVTDVEKPGGLTEITMMSKGRMVVNGFQSPPIISSRQVETSGTYQIAGTMITNPGVPQYELAAPYIIGVSTGVPRYVVASYSGRVVTVGTYTVNVRYLSRQAIIKYQSTVRPTEALQQGTAEPIAGYTILSQDRSTLSGQNVVDGHPSVSVNATHSFDLMCSDLSVDQVALTLFDCQETWEYKYTSSVIWTGGS